jgi:hypothetical protein
MVEEPKQDLSKTAKPPISITAEGDLEQKLSKTSKTVISLFLFWTIWVLFRTKGDDYVFLGIWDMEPWRNDDLILNWFGLPAVFVFVYAAYRWISKD